MYARKRGAESTPNPASSRRSITGPCDAPGGEFDVDQHHVIQSRAVADPALTDCTTGKRESGRVSAGTGGRMLSGNPASATKSRATCQTVRGSSRGAGTHGPLGLAGSSGNLDSRMEAVGQRRPHSLQFLGAGATFAEVGPLSVGWPCALMRRCRSSRSAVVSSVEIATRDGSVAGSNRTRSRGASGWTPGGATPSGSARPRNVLALGSCSET